MADSDEEGDSRKSRDKFKRERSDYGDKYRKDTSSRDDSSRRRSRDYRNEGGRSEFSPPQKRMRRENNWYANGYCSRCKLWLTCVCTGKVMAEVTSRCRECPGHHVNSHLHLAGKYLAFIKYVRDCNSGHRILFW